MLVRGVVSAMKDLSKKLAPSIKKRWGYQFVVADGLFLEAVPKVG